MAVDPEDVIEILGIEVEGRRLIELLGIHEEPGWTGAFSRKQFPEAIPNGTPIVKAKIEAGDTHPVGKRGTVLGSIQVMPAQPVMYFIEWDDMPKCAFACADWKIAPLRQ